MFRVVLVIFYLNRRKKEAWQVRKGMYVRVLLLLLLLTEFQYRLLLVYLFIYLKKFYYKSEL